MNKFIFTVVLVVSAIGGFAMAQGARGMGGGGISGQPIDGTTIKPKSVQASGTADQFMCTATTAVCEVESNINAATMTATVPAFDIGPTATPDADDELGCFSYGATGSKIRVACVDKEGDLTLGTGADTKICLNGSTCSNRFNMTQSNNFIDLWSNNTGVWTATPSFFYVYKQLMAQQPVVSLMASGSQSFSCANLGCRLNLGSTARYLVDDGSRISSPSAIASSDFTKDDFNNLILTGRREDSASSVGIIMRNSFALTTAGSKLVSFRNPTTTEIASIDKDGAYTGKSFNATATSGSSFTGGNSSTTMTLTSNTTDAVTSSTVPAIRLQASENIGNTDLLMSVEDSAGNRRMTLTESGGLVISGSLSPGDVANLNLAGYFSPNPRSITIASDGAGTPAAYTLALGFNRTLTFITCNDSDGCDITISNAAPVAGYHEIVNVSANNLTFTDTAGVSEMAGNFTAGQYDVIKFVAVTDRYVEVSRSDN